MRWLIEWDRVVTTTIDDETVQEVLRQILTDYDSVNDTCTFKSTASMTASEIYVFTSYESAHELRNKLYRKHLDGQFFVVEYDETDTAILNIIIGTSSRGRTVYEQLENQVVLC